MFGTALACLRVGDIMSRIINPLLIDRPAEAVRTSRNFSRAAVQPVEGAAFANELASVQKTSAPSKTAEAQPVQAAQASSLDEAQDGGIEQSARQPVQVASSWRVDRSAAEVNHDDEDFGFYDFLDIINPLHHIPVIGTIYRELTDDKIKPVSRIVGDVLFGAVTGSLVISCVSSVISSAYEQNEGAEPLTHLANALFGSGDKESQAPVMLAQASANEEDGDASANAAHMPVAQAEETAQAFKVAMRETPPEPARDVSFAGEGKVTDKQPYGGVMDAAPAARNQTLAAAPKKQGIRIGNTVYANLQTNAERTASAKQTVPQSKETESAPVSGEKDLGVLMHQSANADASGNALPPELVRDMMLMALDKYKTAGNLAPREMNIGAVN